MHRPFPSLLVAVCLLPLAAPSPLPAQPCGGASAASPLVIEDRYLAERVRRLESRAPSLKAALDSIRNGCVAVRVGTAAGIGASVSWMPARLRREVLGQTAARMDIATETVREIVVRVDVQAIARHLRRQIPPAGAWLSRSRRRARFDALVDAVLIHELWGHAVPLALGGNTRFLCPDPLPGQPDLESCSVRRENGLRVQLGLPPRTRYGVGSSW